MANLKLSKEQMAKNFEAFRKVQMSGKYNMFCDGAAAMFECGLNEEEYTDVMFNYEEYQKVAKEVRNAKAR